MAASVIPTAAYRYSMTEFVRAMRATLNAPNLKFIFGRIYQKWDSTNLLRGAIESMRTEPGCDWVNGDDFTTVDGGGHADPASTKLAGQRMYAAYEALVSR